MTDSLREKLNSVLSPLCDVHLSEAEVDNYPYVVVDLPTTPLRDKDGIYGFSGEARIRVVGDDFDICDGISGNIADAIAREMHDDVFYSILRDIDKECVDGVWTIELNYTLKQYADWEPQAETENE